MATSYGNEVVVVPAGTVITATGFGASVFLGNKGDCRLQVVVTAVAGTTPADTVTIQTSHDNGVLDPWRNLAALPAVNAVNSPNGSAFQSVSGCDRYIRPSHVVTGTTPSLTLSIIGDAV